MQNTPPGQHQIVVIDPPMGVSHLRYSVVSNGPYPGTSAASVGHTGENIATGTPTPPMDPGVIQLSPGQGRQTYHQLQTVPSPHIPGNATTALMYCGRRTGPVVQLEFAASLKK